VGGKGKRGERREERGEPTEVFKRRHLCELHVLLYINRHCIAKVRDRLHYSLMELAVSNELN